MRFRSLAVAAALLISSAPSARAELQVPRVSPNAKVSQTLGLTELTIVYSRPGVKGRAIWGALVPYDKPWRTGANEATTFATTDTIRVEGQTLPPGTYSFFTIPSAGDWTVVFSRQKDLWGAFDYKPDQDQLRVTVKPLPAAESEEWMRFAFEALSPNSVELHLRWEKLDVPVRIEADVVSHVLASARLEVPAAKPDDWRTPFRAAGFCLDNNVAPDEAMKWAKASVAVEANFNNLSLLARVQKSAGQKATAIATAEKAVAAGHASKDKVDTAPTEKLIADWKAEK